MPRRTPAIMLPRLLSVSILCAAAALGAWADNPWKEKRYTDWTMDDVQRILSDSPWVKISFVDAPWIKGDPHFIYTMPPSCPGRPSFERPTRTPPSWNLGPLTSSVVGYQVAWTSARAFRAARLRLSVLCKQTDPDEGDEALENEPDDYVITVQSPDMRPFEGLSEEALTASTNLMLKKTKTKVPPSRVRLGLGPDRQTVYLLVFIFPKTTDSGEPLIAPDEKEIEFVCQANKVTVKAKFQPPKMVTSNGQDL
jgi:hypothetical protein